jgi:phthalate 4,5-cis-dihydrodiol dehydrogenase
VQKPDSPGPLASHPPFFGLTVVSCDKGDIRQSADGLSIYGEDTKREISLPTVETGRDAVIRE